MYLQHISIQTSHFSRAQWLHVASDYYMGSLVLGYLVPIFSVSAYSLPPPGSNLFLSSHAAVKMPLLSLSLSSVQISVYRTEGRGCVSFHP